MCFIQVGRRITKNRHRQKNQRNNGTSPGWVYVHVAIDDHSRVSFSKVLSNKKAVSAVAHLKAGIAYYQSLGIQVGRVMTNNGSYYKSIAFARACKDIKIKHVQTKLYTPKTNGKAERFIQTLLREWAYARIYQTSDRHPAQRSAGFLCGRCAANCGSKRATQARMISGDVLK